MRSRNSKAHMNLALCCMACCIFMGANTMKAHASANAPESVSVSANEAESEKNDADKYEIIQDEGGETSFQPVKGEGTVVDSSTSAEAASGGGKEFYTIQTKDEHTFFLIIDHERGGDNVYFLDQVTEKDLLSLTNGEIEAVGKGDAGKADLEESGYFDGQAAAEVETETETETEKEKGNPAKADAAVSKPLAKSGAAGKLPLILFLTIIGGGAYYYIKIYKPKKQLDLADDIEDYEAVEDGEEEDNGTISFRKGSLTENEQEETRKPAKVKTLREEDLPDLDEEDEEDETETKSLLSGYSYLGEEEDEEE